MSFFLEYIIYLIVKSIGVMMRLLPLSLALWIGRRLGTIAYYIDAKHKSLAIANLKMAFAKEKSPEEIKKIIKTLFENFGQNIIELFRLPLMNPSKFGEYLKIEGREHIEEALKKNKGIILLAMHFGSWELASLSCAMLGHPYKVLVKPQKKFTRLNELLNHYRACSGSVVLSRGMGTRDLIKSLNQNEIVGMVVDQGG